MTVWGSGIVPLQFDDQVRGVADWPLIGNERVGGFVVEVSCDGLCERIGLCCLSAPLLLARHFFTMHKDRKAEYQSSIITRNSGILVNDLLKSM